MRLASWEGFPPSHRFALAPPRKRWWSRDRRPGSRGKEDSLGAARRSSRPTSQASPSPCRRQKGRSGSRSPSSSTPPQRRGAPATRPSSSPLSLLETASPVDSSQPSQKHVKLGQPGRHAGAKGGHPRDRRVPLARVDAVEPQIDVRQAKPYGREPPVKRSRLPLRTAVHRFPRDHQVKALNRLVVSLDEPREAATMPVPRERLVDRVELAEEHQLLHRRIARKNTVRVSVVRHPVDDVARRARE